MTCFSDKKACKLKIRQNNIKNSKQKIFHYLRNLPKSKYRNLSKFFNANSLNLIDDTSIKALETFAVKGLLEFTIYILIILKCLIDKLYLSFLSY